MRTATGCLIGLVLALRVSADPLLAGRVLLPSGAPVAGAQVLLFDLTDLGAAPLAATTDGSGRFTLPLAGLAGVLPERFELGANYPNPFNPSTIIPYQLPSPTRVRLEVFNLLGQRVATLVDGEQPAGFHTAAWAATDASGQAVGAGVYLYRLSGDGAKITRRMLLIDGQAGIPSGRGGSTGSGGEAATEEAGETAPAYGLTVSGTGLVPYVDPAFRVAAGMGVDLVVEVPTGAPRAKVASAGLLGDVDNTGRVDFFDALLVALYSQDSSIVMPNNGDVSLGDVNADGRVDLSDAWVIAAWLNDPSDPSLPSGIGEEVGPAASLSPDPSTVAFADDGSWHRFTVEAGEPVTVVVNPAGTPRGLEITIRSGRGNYCPAEADDDARRRNGQTIYLSGCTAGEARVELRRESDGTVLRSYTFKVSGSAADLVVEAVSTSGTTLTPGQSFTLNATVRNQRTGAAAATTLRWYRSSNRIISTRDTRVGTDPVDALAAAGTSAESISLTAPSTDGTYYYGACVVSVAGESAGNNCSSGVRVIVVDSASEFLLTCPTPAEIEDIDRDLELAFIDDPTANWPLACSAEEGSEDLSVLQMGAYQTMRLMKAAIFLEPLPWTSLSLYDWFVSTVTTVDFDANASVSHAIPSKRKIVISVDIRTDAETGELIQAPFWVFRYRRDKSRMGVAAVGWIQLFVHEARHVEGPGHTCDGGSDQTFAEMGAWAYAYYTLLWFTDKALPADFLRSHERASLRQQISHLCSVRFCQEGCP